MNAFNEIKIRELPSWIRVLQKDNVETKEDMLTELQLVDDLLTLQASKSLLKRKKGLKQMLEARIDKELGYKYQNLNIK